jgi:eukaryotic-like serine/threonine-protein kinase
MQKGLSKFDFFTPILIAGIFILLSLKAFPVFEAMERVVYSAQMRLDAPRSAGENKIAIVNIDDKSLEQLGPWPWPRHLIAEMISILKSNGASLIGLDLMFSQKEQNTGLEEVRDLHRTLLDRRGSGSPEEHYGWVLERLEQIENKLDNDRRLSQTVRECGNIILPVVGKFGRYETELVIPVDSFLNQTVLKPLGISKEIHNHISVNQLVTPFSLLSENSRGLGHINLSPNRIMTGQVHLPFINYRGHVIPSLPLRLAFEYLNKVPEQVIIQKRGIELNEEFIPTTHGEMLIKFKGARRSFPHYSFADILRVKKVPAVFENKIVLIGFTAEGGGVSVRTPVDPEMPMVELTANVIDDFMNGRYLTRPPYIITVEALLILLLTCSWWFFSARLDPFFRGVMTGSILLMLFLAGLLLFTLLDTWFKITYLSLAVVTVSCVLSMKEIVLGQRSLRHSTRETSETNRMLGLSLQSQGLLDLAFEKFRRTPIDETMKEVLYNLGLDFERKRMINKAISVYDHILRGGGSFRDLEERLPQLRRLAGDLSLGHYTGKNEGQILLSEEMTTKPTIGRYEILEELGRGAMGMVYKARDPKINRLVAIKTIRFSDGFAEDRVREVKERFLKEAELSGKLSHPAIVPLYDVGEDYDLTYMAMELIEGKDLESFCTKESLLPLRHVLDIIAEAAEALDYAHTRGVIHRDVKPANIMLLRNGHIKVTDFGIARAVSSSHTRTGIVLGTPNYMSPEQISGEKVDGRSDIYSLGVVFFQLLTGELPFRGETLTDLFYQITQKKHPAPRSLNPRVIKPCEQLIDKVLAKDPARRFQDAATFAGYLRVIGEKMDSLGK